MWSIELLRPVANDVFLANTANWEVTIIKKINTKISKIDLIHWAINEKFNLKARPWQVGVIVDMTKQK